MEIRLFIIKYSGSTLNPTEYVESARSIFGVCGIEIRWNLITPNETQTQADLGNDDCELYYHCNSQYPGRVKARIQGHYDPRSSHIPLNRRQVPVAFVKSIATQRGCGPLMRGYAGYTDEGLPSVCNNSNHPHILAHEIGHFFGEDHDPRSRTNNLMYLNPNLPGYSCTELDTGQCQRILARIR